MSAEYVQCLVCERLTPTNRGICYHCHSPLPSRILLPQGTPSDPTTSRPPTRN